MEDINDFFKLQSPYQKLNSMPDDPENSIAYGLFTQSTQCFVIAYFIPVDKAMNYSDNVGLINGIHNTLTET